MKGEAVSRRENLIKTALVKKLRLGLPGYRIFAHFDRLPGIPDLSVNGHRTFWSDLKFGTPDYSTGGRDLQALNMLRLAHVGWARYLVFQEFDDGAKRTLIVHPEETRGKRGKVSLMTPEFVRVGFDYAFILAYIKERM